MPDLAPVHNARKTKHLSDNDRSRRNQAKRQYKTNSTTWRKLRAQILREEPLCAECTKQGHTTPARDVDHIDGNSWNNHRSNLQALCHGHHSSKTAQENKEKGIYENPWDY